MRWVLAPLLALSLMAGSARARQAEPEIWFNPHGPSVDLMNMWSNDAPWRWAASKVKVLVLVDWWVTNATDAQLLPIIAYAKSHHMELDLDTQSVVRYVGEVCGVGEGYSYPGSTVLQSAQKLLRLGARLDWLDMDEPMGFGRYEAGPNGCQFSVPDLVTRVALNMKDVLAAFPHVKLMEIEPLFSLATTPTWREDETAFHIGLEQQLGIPVQIMQADVQWNVPGWQQPILDWRAYLHQQNLRFGIIYDGSGASTSDADWINSAVANFEAVEGQLHVIPDEVLFTSWNAFPLYNMPETAPTALTWLINRYQRPLSTLGVQFVGGGVHGKLTAVNGKPIANATVNGFKPGVDYSKPMPVTVLSGVVPATAVTAILGVRVNAECGCNGLNDILFGTITYQESHGGTSQFALSYPTTPTIRNGVVIGGETVGGVSVTRVIAEPGQTFLTNSASFPVTAGAQYQFNVPAATVGGLGWFGNVILIFIDKFGNGTRMTVTPGPGKALMSSAVTAADGTFALFPLPRTVDGPNPVTVEFDGENSAYRSTIWTPLP